MRTIMKWLMSCLVLTVLLCGTVVTTHIVKAEGTTSAEPALFDKRRLLVQPRNADGTVIVVPFGDDPVLWLRGMQQNFYKSMSGALKNMRGTNAATAGYTLLLLSFTYGILHAAGPGHGKAVISAWLLATENQLRRGILIAFMSSLIQATTAVVLVCSLLLVLQGAGAAAKNAAAFLESASYAMIAFAGLYLLWGGAKSFGKITRLESVPAQQASTFHGHHFEIVNPVAAEHVHGPDCGCDHAHAPTAADVEGEWSLRKALSLSFAVGIRPCSGAILVLIFAHGMGLLWVGIAATYAMSFGTFITVACIATIAVYAKKLAQRLFAGNTRGLDWLAKTMRIGGGVTIILLGVFLFLGSLNNSGASM